ncbi:MAG: hypothetical protein AAF628_37340 [Planctomycetota bacterium]
MKEWKKLGRIPSPADIDALGTDWKNIEAKRLEAQRELFAAATVEDLPLLLETRATFYRRLSDECLYDVATLSLIINHLARGRYRVDPGITWQVRAKN